MRRDRRRGSWFLPGLLERDAVSGAALLRALREDFEALYYAHRVLWHRDCRAFGWEVLANRYGGAILRITEAAEALEGVLDGSSPVIEELEAEPLPEDPSHLHRRLISAGANW